MRGALDVCSSALTYGVDGCVASFITLGQILRHLNYEEEDSGSQLDVQPVIHLPCGSGPVAVHPGASRTTHSAVKKPDRAAYSGTDP